MHNLHLFVQGKALFFQKYLLIQRKVCYFALDFEKSNKSEY